MGEEPIGKLTRFFPKISVAVIELSADLKVGDKIEMEGEEGPFEQEVTSMQIEHESIKEAKAGQAIGLKTDQPVKTNTDVMKVTE